MTIKSRPLSTLDTVRYHGWLQFVSGELREAVLDRCKFHNAATGDVVYRINDPADGVYGVVRGAFAFEAAPNERGPQLVHAFTAGSWVGEAAVFNDRPRLGTLIALRDSQYLHLPLAEIERLDRRGLSIWRGLGILAGAHAELALVAIDDLTIRPPVERIAAILLRFAGARLADIPDDPTPMVDITQAALAKIGNTSRATVARQLKKLEADGALEAHYGHIKLINCGAIRRMLSDSDIDEPACLAGR